MTGTEAKMARLTLLDALLVALFVALTLSVLLIRPARSTSATAAPATPRPKLLDVPYTRAGPPAPAPAAEPTSAPAR